MIKNLSTKQLIKLYKMRVQRRELIHNRWMMYQYATTPYWFYAKMHRILDRQCQRIRSELNNRNSSPFKSIEVLPQWEVKR